MNYIDLNRLYRLYKEDNNISLLFQDEDFGTEYDKTLDEIIKTETNNIIIILGDKGSGKTTEMNKYCEKNNKKSFFFSLDNLKTIEVKKLNKLKNNFEKINIFLDSIDECRLTDNLKEDNFEKALNFISSQIKDTSKFNFIISSRERDWFENKEKNIAIIKKHLFYIGYKDKKEDKKNEEANIEQDKDKDKDTTNTKGTEIRVYKLLGLNDKQIEKIADKYLKEKRKQFVELLENNNIYRKLSSTPMECIETINYYKRNRNISSSIHEFLIYKLNVRYRELNKKYQNNNNNFLSFEKIKFLSKRLAISTFLCKKISIISKENYDNFEEENNDSILLNELFPEEESKILDNYINSSLFSFNGKNRVKFYDDYLRTYLAFLWLKDRVEKNKYKNIEQLLFINQVKILYPKKSFLIPLVMLASENYKIRKFLTDFYPDILLKYSHFLKNITLQDKKDIFIKLYSKYSYRIRDLIFGYHWYNANDSIIGTASFSDKNLSQLLIKYYDKADYYGQYLILTILSNLKKDDISNDIKKQILFKVFNENIKSGDILQKTLEILMKLDDKDTISKLNKYLTKNRYDLYPNILDLLINKLYTTKQISFDSILDIWKGYKDIDKTIRLKNIFYIIDVFINTFIKDDTDKLTKILEEFLKIDTNILAEKKWLLAACIYSIINLMLLNFSEEKIINYIFKIQNIFDDTNNIVRNYDIYGFDKTIEKLKTLINNKKDIHIKLLKLFIKKYCDEKNIRKLFYKDTLYDISSFTLKHLLELTKSKDLSENQQEELLSFIISQKCDFKKDKKLIKLYLDSNKKKEIYNNYNNYLKEIIKNSKRDVKFEWQIKEEADEKKYKEYLLKNINKIKSADKSVSNIFEYLTITYHDTDYRNVKFEIIESKYGKRFVNAYKKGLQIYWKTCDVNNYKKFIDVLGTNKILNQSIVALAGISIFLDSKKSIENFNLNPEEIKRIIYFEVQALNKFHPLFEKIVVKHKKEAIQILKPIIKKELSIDTKEYFGILGKLADLSLDAINNIYDTVLKIVNSKKEYSKTSMLNALHLLLKKGITKEIREKILQNINYKDPISSIPFYKLLFDNDIKLLIRKLKEQIKKIKDASTKYRFITTFCSSLSNYDYNKKYDKQMDIEDLKFFIPLLFNFVPPEKDPVHNSGFSSPLTDIDGTIAFRNSLFTTLKLILNKDNIEIVKKLADDIKDNSYKNDLLIYIDNFLIDDSNEETKKEKDIIDFEQKDYFEPNSNKELFDIVCHKLDDIKNDIEKSDFSIKQLYHHLAVENGAKDKKIINEEFFQKFILMEFRRSAKELYSIIGNPVYSVVREPEVSNKNKPDLQVWYNSWCINIECKVIDSWSFNELVTALKDQLIEKYLKYPEYKYGILLLARMKKKLWKNKGKSISYYELIDKLQAIANKEKHEYEHIEDIKIVFIDYSDN